MRVTHIITRLVIGGAQENTLLTVDGLHHRQMTLVEKWFEGLHGRVEAEEAIQVDQLVFGDRDRGPQLVIVTLAVGDHDVEPIGSAAQDFANGARVTVELTIVSGLAMFENVSYGAMAPPSVGST